MAARRLAELGLALALAGALPGCLAYSNVKRDTDRQPIVHTGVGGMVLMPGQGAPSLPESVYGRGYGGAPTQGGGMPPQSGAAPGYGGATSGSYNNNGSGSSGGGSGYAAGPPGAGGAFGGPGPGSTPSAGNLQFIGGAELDEVKHRQIKQEPLIIKTLLVPLAIVALPFKKAYEAARGDPRPVIEPPPPQAAPPGPPDYEAAYEDQQLQALERQLGGEPGDAPPARGLAPPQTAAAPRARPSSISDELALLQRRVPPRGVDPGAGAGPGGPASGTPPGVADRVNDGDGDGRPDQWQYRENGVLVRELFDQNGDGRVDRTVLYDPATGAKRSEEDDVNQDGRVDSWVEYQGGQVVRRRQDASGDGEPDAWTFYRGGQVARIEEDRDGDGFRDRIGHYDAGKVRRELEDTNGDGRPDRITLYDAQERVQQRSEDRDGDGLVDARSFYQNGKLVRRELVDEGAAGETLEEESLGTSGAFSDGTEPAPPAPPRAAIGGEG